jgi:hypothetical protein
VQRGLRIPKFQIKIKQLKRKKKAGRQWLMPVILVTQGADIRRIKIQSQP